MKLSSAQSSWSVEARCGKNHLFYMNACKADWCLMWPALMSWGSMTVALILEGSHTGQRYKILEEKILSIYMNLTCF